MKIRAVRFLIVVFLIVLIGGIVNGQPININACTVIDQPGYYVLNRSIINSGASKCIEIVVSDVVLDGRGHVIDGTLISGTYGVYAKDVVNISIVNVSIREFDTGIEFLNVSNSRIENNTITNNDLGIWFTASSNNTVANNTIISNSHNGLSLDRSNNNIISENNISNNTYGRGIYLYNSENNTIVSNKITNNGYEGVLLRAYSNDNEIAWNNISGNNYGIYLTFSTNNTIASNVISNNSNIGVYLNWFYNTITSNTIDNNSDGISVFASYNTIAGNTISNNRGIGVRLYATKITVVNNVFIHDGLVVVWGSYNNTVENNTVNGKPLVYLENQRNVVIENAGQVIVLNSENITVRNLNLSFTDEGVEFLNVNNSRIENCTITNNVYGIDFGRSNNNTITGNNISNNYRDGIGIYRSSNNTIAGNTISSNYIGVYCGLCSDTIVANNTISGSIAEGAGVYFDRTSNSMVAGNSISNNTIGVYFVISSNNTIVDNTISNNYWYGVEFDNSNNNLIYNNLFNNTNNVSLISAGTNTWNTTLTLGTNILGGNYIGGNAWLSPDGNGFSETCADSDGDVICDNPFVIDSNNIDYYPLAKPSSQVDTTPPTVIVISPQNNTVYSTSTIQINVSATDPSGIDIVIAQIDGTTNVTLSLSNGYYVGTVNLADGKHKIRIYANDTFGNMNSSVVVYFSVDTSLPSVIYVPDDYARIKWAVENATAGSIIYVRNGTYEEYNINVTKSLKIIGLDYPVLTSPQDRNTFYGFNISANNVTISGFNFSGFAGYVFWGNRYGTGIPIRVNGSDIRIENCTFGIYNGETNDYGILIENSKNVEIYNCSIFTSNLRSIEIRNSENVTVIGSRLINSSDPWKNVNGIYILGSFNVAIYNNILSINTAGVKDGIVVDSSNNCSIIGNRISGSGIEGAIVVGFSNAGGSSNCTIKDNIIEGTKFGIYVGTFSNHNLIENNTVKGVTAGYTGWCCYLGAYGIEIAGDYNLILNNTVVNSTYLGMVVEGCGNVLRNNTMKDNFINFRYEAECSEPNYIDSSNTVDGKIIGYYYNVSNIMLNSNNIGTVILERCSNVKLEDLNLSRNFYGALILKSENVTLENVTAVNNMRGITLEFSRDVKVANCAAIKNHLEGVWIRHGGIANVTVENCNISGNGNGIVVMGHHAYTDAWIENVSIVNNDIFNNTLDLLADWGNYGILIDLAKDVNVKRNEIHENRDGIKLQSSASALIEDNRIYNNSEAGVLISDNSYGEILRNIVFNSTYGIKIDTSRAFLEGDEVRSNEYGLYVFNSEAEGMFSHLHNNTVGIFSQLSTTNISYSNIVNNSWGVVFEEHWMHGGSGNFTFNNIVNYQYNFVNNETYNISAINNWWGTTNETLIELKILDYYDNNQTGVVFYKPYINYSLIFDVKGDFNYNGVVDIADVTMVAYMIVGKVQPNLLADFNNNGRVDVGDLAKMAYYVLGRLDKL